MTFNRFSDGRKVASKSSISLPFDVNIGLVIDNVLDTSILQKTWARLIGRSSLLGGVLRSKNRDPRKVHCGSTIDFEGRFLGHDIATFLPFSWYGRDKPTILHDEMRDIDGKFLFNALSDPKPVCLLRATVLRDATLLCFSFVHSIFDGQSCFDIIRFFCDLLNRRDIPRFILPPDVDGRMSDLLEGDGEGAVPSYRSILGTSRLRQMRFFGKVLVQKTRELFHLSERLTYRLIHVPSAWVDEVRSKAQKELEGNGSSVKLTRNDIIAALYLKMLYSPKRARKDPVDFIGPVNYRGLLKPLEEATYYPHNSIIFLRSKLSECQVTTSSIGQVAEKIRLSTMQYQDPTVIRAELKRIEDKVVPPAVMEPRGNVQRSIPLLSPWTTFNYADLDFSGASCQGRKASVVFVNPDISLIGGTLPTLLLVSLKDCDGGYWLRGSNTPRGWEDFEHCTSLKTLLRAGE
ncbi:uncharacterized protein BDV14DRAFT_177811 [Aspergillus stella-maris]|uniref:uncharacterized protein n=1 Tax=Aspergillus stella-maris TaxID=1810926 RepID=UPI003CCCAE18